MAKRIEPKAKQSKNPAAGGDAFRLEAAEQLRARRCLEALALLGLMWSPGRTALALRTMAHAVRASITDLEAKAAMLDKAIADLEGEAASGRPEFAAAMRRLEDADRAVEGAGGVAAWPLDLECDGTFPGLGLEVRVPFSHMLAVRDGEPAWTATESALGDLVEQAEGKAVSR